MLRQRDFDGDGAETATDLSAIKKYLIAKTILTGIRYDVNGDCFVTSEDVDFIRMYLIDSNVMLSSMADIDGNGSIEEADRILLKELLKTI